MGAIENESYVQVLLDAIAGYTYTYGKFVDVSTCVYDWCGRCVRARRQAGETDSSSSK